MEEIKELIHILNQARNAYYNTGQPIMSDKEYDSLYDELKELETKTSIVYGNSPTQSVGYSVLEGLRKAKHKYSAKSLDKTKDRDDINKFLSGRQGLISFKLDGLTTVLTYENGKLVSAVTRGNGEIGDDITENAHHFKNIPLAIPYKETLILRGESVISYSTFEKINTNNEYKNPRNLVAGTIRNLDSKVVADREVEWICFEVVEGFDNIFDLKSTKLSQVGKYGFDVVNRYVVNVDISSIEAMTLLETQLEHYPYPTDGLVATFDNVSYSKSLGETSHHPLDSLVLKWQDETFETTLIDIEWQVGRTGVVTPVAIFEPVDLDGAITTRASLHNLDILDSLELGIGDTVTVYRANMVIPQIDDNLTRSNTYEYPLQCPECGSLLKVRATPSRFAVCENPSCKAKLLGRLSHFVSRDAMSIDGLSEETLRKFIDKGWIKTFSDIYELRFHENEIKSMEGFGVRSYNKLIQSIEKSKSCKAENFLYGLGIDGVGKSTAKALVKKFKDIDTLQCATKRMIKEIDGIGDVVATSVYNYFSNTSEWKFCYGLLNFEQDTTQQGNLLNGLTFVITGSIDRFSNRKELQAKIESLGGKVSGSVSTNSNFLINNDIQSTTGKNKRAIELGVKIINEDDFLGMINK